MHIDPRRGFGKPTSARSPWRTRGYLPHFEEPGLIQGITFRVIDSLPRKFLDRCEQELQSLPEHRRQIEKEKRISKMLDHGIGKCHLRDPRVASVVENALLFFDTERYNLPCWGIMPNHVHSMIETFESYGLDDVVHSWKSYTSNEANKILGRRGSLWQRYVRYPSVEIRHGGSARGQGVVRLPLPPGTTPPIRARRRGAVGWTLAAESAGTVSLTGSRYASSWGGISGMGPK